MFLIEYIKKYKVTYISVIVTFIVGIILGIFVTFKIPENDKQSMFKEKLVENFKTLGVIWFLGCTIIASFTIYIFMIYKGVLFGYIITIIFLTLGFNSGFKFLMLTIFIKSIITYL